MQHKCSSTDFLTAAAHNTKSRFSGPALALALACAGFLASPAAAEVSSHTRLVSCGDESCLQIRGLRDSAAMAVLLNGQEVSVDGDTSWRLTLPLEQVRQMSQPGAREIEISLLDPATQQQFSGSARLPIGLLGDITELDQIRVTAS